MRGSAPSACSCVFNFFSFFFFKYLFSRSRSFSERPLSMSRQPVERTCSSSVRLVYRAYDIYWSMYIYIYIFFFFSPEYQLKRVGTVYNIDCSWRCCLFSYPAVYFLFFEFRLSVFCKYSSEQGESYICANSTGIKPARLGIPLSGRIVRPVGPCGFAANK